MATDSIPQKRCSKCNTEYPRTTECFEPRKTAKDGLRNQCRSCYRAQKQHARDANREHYQRKGREWAENNRERRNELNRESDRRHIDKRRAKRREWKFKNKEYISQKNKEFRLAHPDLMKQRRKDQHKRNPHQSRNAAIKRRARLRNAEGTIRMEDIVAQGESQKWFCWWCDKPVGDKYHADHRIPLAKGGSNHPENMCVTCVHCNSSKRDLMPWEFNGRLL